MAFERSANSSPRTAGWALLLLGLTALAYLPVLRAGWVWDDNLYVTSNPLLTAPDGLWRIWFSTDAPSQYFPLVYTMFRVEYTLWELNPVGYHVVNVLLHALNALLLWRLLTRLRIPGSWLAAAIFALHPVQVESVAWVTEGKNTLSTLLSLATLWVWLTSLERAPSPRLVPYLGSLSLFAAALFAKTTACTLPAAQVIILWWRRELSFRRFLGVLPFFVLAVAMGLLTIWWERHHQGTQGAQFALTGVEAVLVAGRAVFFYLGKLLWPSPLAFSYPRFQIDGAAPWQWAWPLLALGLAAVLWASRDRFGRGPFAALAFFVATLSPLLGFIPLYTFRYTYVADHYQYVACIGPIVLFAAGAVRLTERAGSLGRQVGFVATAALILVLALLSNSEARNYRDLPTLWTSTIARNPDCSMCHNNLGIFLASAGRRPEAIVQYEEALRLRPDDAGYHLNLGSALVSEGRTQEAIAQYGAALSLKPDFAEAHYDLANALARVGRGPEAIVQYEEALRLRPDDPGYHLNLGSALVSEGRTQEAIAQLEKALSLKPDLSGSHLPEKISELKAALVLEQQPR